MKFAFFDLDSTLVDTDAAVAAWSEDFVREYGLQDATEVGDFLTSVETWRRFVDAAPARYGIDVHPDELWDWAHVTYTAKFTLLDGAASGLARLRENGWRLAIVTNGTTAMQQAKIATVRLAEAVDVIVDSEGAGSRKPEREIFEIAAGKLGVGLGRGGWMVGDNFGADIAGGANAGLRTIWLPRRRGQGAPLGGSPAADGPQPDYVCATIAEAIEIVLRSDVPA